MALKPARGKDHTALCWGEPEGLGSMSLVEEGEELQDIFPPRRKQAAGP